MGENSIFKKERKTRKFIKHLGIYSYLYKKLYNKIFRYNIIMEINKTVRIHKKCEHGRRKSICKDCGGSQICEHKRIKSTCKECVGGSICEHGNIRCKCIDCGGSQMCSHGKEKKFCKDCNGKHICEHGKRKNICIACHGSQICEHGRRKNTCRECGGSQICEHGKRKTHCKVCGGSVFCEHEKQKSHCKECGGVSICEHGRRKSICKICGGFEICQHGKLKYCCKECHGSAICLHGKRKRYCKECFGTAFCGHGKRKTHCRECGGSAFCKHDKVKSRCKECNGSQLCKTQFCETRSQSKYNGYCLPCCIQICPEIEVSKNYKTKENHVVERITQTFIEFTWVADKKVQDGCSRRRPDLLLDMGSHIIIVEIDENKHTDYDCSCEHKRLMELSQDLQHRPVVFIRFNPDDYTNQEGVLVKSCWKLNKLGVMTIPRNKQKEWEERIECLKQQIQYWIDNPTDKTIEIVELFY
jgi:hypothetical protein